MDGFKFRYNLDPCIASEVFNDDYNCWKDIARIRKTMQFVTKTCYNLSLRTLLVLRNMKINRSVISNLLWTKADVLHCMPVNDTIEYVHPAITNRLL